MPNGDILGTELYQKRATPTLPVLVRQAQARQPIFYSDLADEVDMPNPRNLNNVLDCVGEALLGLQEKWKESIPPVQCIVINRKTRIPSEGVFWFIKDRDAFK